MKPLLIRALQWAKPLSIAAFVLGSLLWIPAAIFYKESQPAAGRVIRMIQDAEYSFPVFAFTDPQGAEHTIKSDFGSAPPSYAVGDPISIRYVPGDPSSARIDSFWSLWFIPVVTQIVAVVWFLISLALGRFIWPSDVPPPLPPPLDSRARRAS